MDSLAVLVARFYLESSTARSKIHTKISMQSSLLSFQPELPPLHSIGRSISNFFPTRQRAPVPSSRISNLFLTRCSTRPGIGKDSATNLSPAVEVPDSSSTALQQVSTTTPSIQALSPTLSRGLVFDLGSKPSWDSAEIGSLVVKRFIGDNEERWYMWYHRRSLDSSFDSIGLAVSSNGLHWARVEEQAQSCGDVAGVVMECSKNWWAFDTESVRPSEMVILSSPMYSSVYWLYYTGFSSKEVDFSQLPNISIENPERVEYGKEENQVKGRVFKSLPGLACSQDGKHWARIEGDHHSGALLDFGSTNEWDSLFIASPQVVIHSSNDLRMYYYSFDAENCHFGIGMARSRDGIRWVKLGQIMGKGTKGSFDELGVKSACVVRKHREAKYMMAYEGVDANGLRSIGLAVSPDGLKNWERVQEGPILRPSEEECGWDCKGVSSPYLVNMDVDADEWRLYYVGAGQEGRTGIGMAFSESSDVTTFKKWEGYQFKCT